MGDVVNLKLETVGDGYRFNPDALLEKAKGEPFDTLLIIGQMEDGELYLVGSANAGESLILLERVKDVIVHG